MVYKGFKSAAEKHRDKVERQKTVEATLRAQQVSSSFKLFSFGSSASCGVMFSGCG